VFRLGALVALAAVGPGLAACRGEREAARRPAAAAEAEPIGAAAPGGAARTVLFLGTSLTAGYGLDPEQAYPVLIQRKLDEESLPYRVVNAGLSGESSAGALRRLDWLLRQPFDVLVLETGANDMLRGADLDSLEANLQAIIDRVHAQRPGAEIVLVGMRAPPNMGLAYASRFRSLYPELAERNDLPLVPFLLDGVAGRPELNLPDAIHPNAQGQERVAENVWRVLDEVLRERAEASR
jgi:acyl-CoA thioesterase-1